MHAILFVSIFITSRFIYVKGSLQDVVFPPPFIDTNNPENPPGHLKPLGWQKQSDGPVKEYDHVLNTQEYWDKHVKPRTPCVFRQAIKKSPALSKWTDEYLKEKYGDLDVLVELKRENRTFSTGRLRFQEFLNRYKKDDLYVVTMLPKAMMSEVQAVNSVLCGTFKNFTHESNFWMSNGGTRSVIHYDADHNLHCMIAGRKDLIMVKNTQQNRKWLYMSAKPVTAGSGFSPLNPDVIDLKKFPNYAKVPWLYTTILPGDCVYIPAIYIHQVRAYGRSLSVTTLFTEEIVLSKKHFTSEGCSDKQLMEYHTMDDIDFHWTYVKGDETIDMGYMNVERLRHIFIYQLQQAGRTEINFKFFSQFYIEFSHGEAQLTPEKVWTEILGHKLNETTSISAIKAYTREQLKLLARSFDPPHGPKTNGLEEVSFMPGDKKDDEDLGAGSLKDSEDEKDDEGKDKGDEDLGSSKDSENNDDDESNATDGDEDPFTKDSENEDDDESNATGKDEDPSMKDSEEEDDDENDENVGDIDDDDREGGDEDANEDENDEVPKPDPVYDDEYEEQSSESEIDGKGDERHTETKKNPEITSPTPHEEL